MRLLDKLKDVLHIPRINGKAVLKKVNNGKKTVSTIFELLWNSRDWLPDIVPIYEFFTYLIGGLGELIKPFNIFMDAVDKYIDGAAAGAKKTKTQVDDKIVAYFKKIVTGIRRWTNRELHIVEGKVVPLLEDMSEAPIEEEEAEPPLPLQLPSIYLDANKVTTKEFPYGTTNPRHEEDLKVPGALMFNDPKREMVIYKVPH